MRVQWFAWMLCYGSVAFAQTADPHVVREATAVRANVLRSAEALRHYGWTERIDVLVNGKAKSSMQFECGYNENGLLVKKPLTEAPKTASNKSNRPIVRKRADMEDYIDRAINLTQGYIPLKPERMEYMLDHGQVFIDKEGAGESDIRFKDYYQDGDSLVFTYNAVSKELLRIRIVSNLGTPKDPVSLETVFEILPGGLNHVASTVLIAKARKVQVKTTNFEYRKVTN